MICSTSFIFALLNLNKFVLNCSNYDSVDDQQFVAMATLAYEIYPKMMNYAA